MSLQEEGQGPAEAGLPESERRRPQRGSAGQGGRVGHEGRDPLRRGGQRVLPGQEARPHPGAAAHPFSSFFEIPSDLRQFGCRQVRDALYPTVYLLWTVPPGSWLPVFTTWLPVVAKLQKGADLMLPGVIVDAAAGRWAYGRSLARGAAVGVDTSANAAPVAVGRAALASDDLYMAAGRGKAVEILHCVGDKLWELGGARPAPELGPPQRFCTAPAPPPHADADADPSRPGSSTFPNSIRATHLLLL